jgi:hypothetical protein
MGRDAFLSMFAVPATRLCTACMSAILFEIISRIPYDSTCDTFASIASLQTLSIATMSTIVRIGVNDETPS